MAAPVIVIISSDSENEVINDSVIVISSGSEGELVPGQFSDAKARGGARLLSSKGWVTVLQLKEWPR